MNAHPAPTDYSFEHGIDHCGYDGVAPILYVGGPVVAHDFVERDLMAIRGVSISQRGLSKGIKWSDLNLLLLFSKLPKIEYLRIDFDDPVCLDDLGLQPSLRFVKINCPKVRGSLQGEMPLLRTAEVQWSDECTAKLNAPRLERLTLIRPRFQDLSSVLHLTSLHELDLWYARNFCSFQGLERLAALTHLGLHNCSKVTDLSSVELQPGPHELVVGGCKRFVDASAAPALKALRKLSIYADERSTNAIHLPRSIKSLPIQVDLRGVVPVWV